MASSGFPVVTPLLVLWVVVGWVKRKRLGVVRKRNVKSSYLKLTTMSFEALDAIFVEFNQYSLFLALIFLLFIWNQTSHYPPCLVQKSEPCHYNPDVDVTTVGSNKLESWNLFSSVCSKPDNSLSFSSAVHITVYIFIGSQIELKIETAVSQKLNFTPRGRVLNFPIQIWERAGPVRQKIWISNAENCHPLSFIINRALDNWGGFFLALFKMKSSVEFVRLRFR